MREFVCAYCRTEVDASGDRVRRLTDAEYEVYSCLPDSEHGCCLVCKKGLLEDGGTTQEVVELSPGIGA